MGTDFSAVERELHRIPGITAARIVTDHTGTPTEVHILAAPGKHPRQVVRDVQSVAKATFDLTLDHRMISVVQLDGEQEPTTPAPIERIMVEGVATAISGYRCRGEVTLARGEDRAVGTAEGAGAATVFPRLVAEATLGALRQLEPGAGWAEVESVAVARVGERHVATVTILLTLAPYEEVVAGSAVVRAAGEQDAVARAVLAATNRRLQTPA